MPSIESKIMPSVSSLINFIKSQVRNNLVEANNKNIIKLEMEELERVSNLVELSIENAYTRGMSEVTSKLNKLKV
jgi:hypothetical protein